MCHIRNLTIANFTYIKMFLLLKFHSCLQSRMSTIRVLADVLLSVRHTKTETERQHLLSRSGWCPMRTMKRTWSKLILQEQGKTSNSWNSASPKKEPNHFKLCVLNAYRANLSCSSRWGAESVAGLIYGKTKITSRIFEYIEVRKIFQKKNPIKIIGIPVTAPGKPLELLVGQSWVESDVFTQKTFSTSLLIPRHDHNFFKRLQHEKSLDVQKIMLIMWFTDLHREQHINVTKKKSVKRNSSQRCRLSTGRGCQKRLWNLYPGGFSKLNWMTPCTIDQTLRLALV